ncbi:hypothetical protein M758_8G132300 [Ceratodon purpureus]|uniref:Mitotic-spindle organizing protein 1 n=1 Tax=Ceratodon purpureus TaxID=3225 RepID=A0A8T0H3T6_CERPU|nr:hypothetical protein KC19_8G137400 [Ceratodon purpureus]KAG0608787.1 hypothetical protein M758_8G132300 [Ceratodon purpureus]
MAPSTPLTQEQQNVLELTQLAGLDIREDVFLIIFELMQSDVAPMLVLQLLKSLAGVGPEATSPAGSSRSGPSETGA